MATLNQAGAGDTGRQPPTEERPPSDQRADKGPRKIGLWAIVVGAIVLGSVLATLEFPR